MTLRPESMTALLAIGVLACAIHFAERGTTAPLVIAVALASVAVTGHHAGIVAIAPLLAISGRILRWSRANFAAATALVTTLFGLVLILAFSGSDLDQRIEDARLFGAYGTGEFVLVRRVQPIRAVV